MVGRQRFVPQAWSSAKDAVVWRVNGREPWGLGKMVSQRVAVWPSKNVGLLCHINECLANKKRCHCAEIFQWCLRKISRTKAVFDRLHQV
jgi:hypothetical protein